MSPLETRIWKTVAWFSLFETPVTVFEIWRWMFEPDRAYGLDEVYAALDGEGLRGKLVGKDGYWALSGDQHPALVSERRTRFLDAARKYGKLRRATRYLSRVPGVVGIAAGNTLAWWNTRPESDIDLFIVTRPGSVWTSRLLCVLPFALLGKRPGASAVDPFCFSFFASEDALDLRPLGLDGGDPYLDYWVRSLVPVFDRESVFDRFRSENARPASSVPTPGVGTRWFERAARRFQLRRLPRRIREMMNVDSRVVVTDSMLKFHDQDRRAEYRDALASLCREPA